MYESFFGFKDKPFQLVPNPAYLYLSAKHKDALTHLEYGLMESIGFILLTGGIGTGKTTLIRRIINQFDADIDVANLFNTNVTPDQLIVSIVYAFGLRPSTNGKAGNLERLYHYLIDKYAAQRRVLLIIDEAQNLSCEALEEIRMLSNLQSDDQILLQIMLVGQPELIAKLNQPRLAQLRQRIAVDFHLNALSPNETVGYIIHRLKTAGAPRGYFTLAAAKRIHEAARGIPRRINILCDRALAHGFADDLLKIDTNVIAGVLREERR